MSRLGNRAVLVLVLGGGFAAATACSDSDHAVAPSNAGGNESVGGHSGAGHTAGVSGSTENPGGDGGDAGAAQGGSTGGRGGSAGHAGRSGGGAGRSGGGAGRDSFAGASGAAEGGSAGETSTATLACPALDTPFTVSSFPDESDENVALAKAFHCQVGDGALRTFSVSRFQVQTPSVEVWWSPYSTTDTYDQYKLAPDCGAAGLLTPGPLESYTLYPEMIVQLLAPGTYTRIACQATMETVNEPVPAAPTNVDCAHAKPLPFTVGDGLEIPAAALAETRILEAARFYSVTLAEDSDLYVYLGTAQSTATVDATLTRTSPVFNASDSLLYTELDTPLLFHTVPAGTFCLELHVTKGAKYSIWGEAQAN